MIRGLRRLTWALALVGTAATHASELDAARKDAGNGTAALEARPCPALGERNYVRGITQPQQLASAADRERVYEDGALQQLQQISRDPKLTQGQRTDLASLASWSVAASLANWSLLQIAQQALANPLIAAGQPYPIAPLESARDRLRQTGSNPAFATDAAAMVRRQAEAVERCTTRFNASVFKLNEPQFTAAIDSAASLNDLSQVEQRYHAKAAASGGYGADSLDKLNARRTLLTENERIARGQANAADAAEVAKRQAELRAKLPAFLAVAKRFADASQGGNESAALAELSPDVVMNTPTGSYRGINQVTAAVRQQSAAGQSGSLGTPRIQNDRIVANGRSGAYDITTTFGFDAGNHIARIDISL